MAQTALITLTTAGADTGPFDLYSDVDGYSVPFETGVSKASLVAGYTSTLIPNGATIVRVQSDNVLCTNYIDLYLVPTTTTTTSSTSTTTSTSSTTTTTTTAAPSTVTIDACGSAQADSSGNVVVYAYSTSPVATNITVDVTWTASDLSMISGIITILAGETCGTITLTGADPNEGGAGLEILSITPGSFGSQTYVEGVETLSSSCTTCPIP
jgi:hypothetical protein